MSQVVVTYRSGSVLCTDLVRNGVGRTHNPRPISSSDPPFRGQCIGEAFKARRGIVHFLTVPFAEDVIVEQSLGTRLEPFAMLQMFWKQNVLHYLSFKFCMQPEQYTQLDFEQPEALVLDKQQSQNHWYPISGFGFV